MTLEATVYTVLSSDNTLMALLEGGLYAYAELPPRGLTRDGDGVTAFDDTTGRMLLCAVVKQRARNLTGAVRDMTDQVSSYRQVVEIWLYDDLNYVALEDVKATVYGLLQHQKFNGFTALEWVNDEQGHAPEYQEAPFMRMDFEAYGIVR